MAPQVRAFARQPASEERDAQSIPLNLSTPQPKPGPGREKSLAFPRRNRFSRKMIKTTACLLAAAALTLAGTAQAGSTKGYQVTGPVLEMNDSMIVVQKGKERWEIARDANTKITGDVKVGSKVTVMYTMTATDVEVKGEKAAEKKK